MPKAYYVDTIHAYLMEQHHTTVVKVHQKSRASFPWALAPHAPSIPGLGANAGAIRPASGYPSCSFKSKSSAPSMT
ncbi:MAG: hypothetical protein CM15mP18_3840 [Methanobacteriota archaeon]|nr:MAG: hypothetical protein CM15mP18_3840 [Euryarchaeota archaeon]